MREGGNGRLGVPGKREGGREWEREGGMQMEGGRE